MLFLVSLFSFLCHIAASRFEKIVANVTPTLPGCRSQVRIAKLRLLQQQRQSLVALPPAESAISASPSIGYRSTRNEVDGKENDWQPLRRPPVVSSGTFESEFVKQVVKKRSSRILPPGFHTIGKAGIESRKSLKQRNPLKDITNR